MGSRNIYFDDDAVCDNCGKIGAYDFMGDWLCPECTRKALGEPEPCNICGAYHIYLELKGDG